jgi:uncharacterized protein YprB with RNaseH-like and TPR domain
MAKIASENERVGFLDIETSNLVADFGIILSYCIKPLGHGKKIDEARITKKDIREGREDGRVVEKLLRDLTKYDRVVTYYGTRFDIPYVRTRAMVNGVGHLFPSHGVLAHTDLYYVVRSRFKLSSNRLENANRVLLGKTQKTRVDSKYWRGGVRGDRASLEYILDHNRKDVLDLEKLYLHIKRYMRPMRRSA